LVEEKEIEPAVLALNDSPKKELVAGWRVEHHSHGL
jgi:hypothetical protein